MTRGGRGSKINGFYDDVVYVRPLVAPKITRLLIQKSSLSSIFNKAEKFPIKPTTQDPLFGPVWKETHSRKDFLHQMCNVVGALMSNNYFLIHCYLMVNFALCRICFCLKREIKNALKYFFLLETLTTYQILHPK